MDIDFRPFFERYKELVYAADAMFDQVKNRFPDCVKCKTGCSDCCYALFDLTLIEAMYINHKFNELFQGEEKEKILAKANEADRQAYKIKRAAYKKVENGEEERKVLTELSEERIRCPLLNDGDMCLMYAERPITCRIYGLPTSIGGQGYTCGKSGFEPGEKYPTVNIDALNDKLYLISEDFVKAIRSKHHKMADILAPLSMSLLTDYNGSYLGINRDTNEENK